MKISKPYLTACIFGAIVFLGASYYVTQLKEEVALIMQVRIAEQEQTLAAIAEITDQNGADSVAADIIRDCPADSRIRFESLLNRLGSLSGAELVEIESLFDACASFFSERKAIMVARMEREFEVYRDYVDLYTKLDVRTVPTQYQVSDWEKLTQLEKRRGDLLREQVAIQATIIAALQEGLSITSDLEKELVRAQQITQEAGALNQQIDTVRQELYDV